MSRWILYPDLTLTAEPHDLLGGMVCDSEGAQENNREFRELSNIRTPRLPNGPRPKEKFQDGSRLPELEREERRRR